MGSNPLCSAGDLTGPDIAYIYPDFLTALVGTFAAGVLVEAQEALVTRTTEDLAGIKVPVFTLPAGPTHTRQMPEFDTIYSGGFKRDNGVFPCALAGVFGGRSCVTMSA